MFFIENEGQAVARTDYWQSVDMPTSAGMPAQPGCLSRMRQNIYSGRCGGLSTSSSVRERSMAAMRWNWYLKTAAMHRS